MRKMTKAEIEERLWDAGVHPDALTVGKMVTVKESYFYRTGKSAEALAEKVQVAFHQAKLEVEDRYANWPKTSYFVVKFPVPTME